MLHNGSSESCESASTSSIGSNNSHNNASKAPGAQLQHKSNSLYHNSLSNGGKATSIVSNSTIANFPDFTPDLRKQVGEQRIVYVLFENPASFSIWKILITPMFFYYLQNITYLF